jgi:hypothetical protein
MGLKTTNYVSKSTGIYMPVAFALLKTLIVEADNRARAIFAVQTDRESANTYKAIDKVEVHFTWDRKTDPAKMAYEAAKTEVHDEEVYDANGNRTITRTEGVLYGWEDDMV